MKIFKIQKKKEIEILQSRNMTRHCICIDKSIFQNDKKTYREFKAKILGPFLKDTQFL